MIKSTGRWNYSLTLLLGGMSGCVTSLIIMDWFPLPAKNQHLGFIFHYQSLVAGFIALLAALITASIIFLQIQKDQERHLEQKRKKLDVYRAYMSDALADLADMCRDYFDYIDDVNNNITASIPEGNYQEKMTVLKDSVGFLEGETLDAMKKTIIFMQVHRSRIRSFEHDIANNHIKPTRVLSAQEDTVRLNALITRLFDFARNEPPATIKNDEPTAREMHNSLRALHRYKYTGITNNPYLALMDLIDEYYEAAEE